MLLSFVCVPAQSTALSTLVAALMRLGPNFVRLHLPQLLILWKNALPKPTSKDASTAQVRTETEWAFLLHIRECTLSALLAFFKYNGSKLVTPDVGRRIAVMLNNGFWCAWRVVSLGSNDF